MLPEVLDRSNDLPFIVGLCMLRDSGGGTLELVYEWENDSGQIQRVAAYDRKGRVLNIPREIEEAIENWFWDQDLEGYGTYHFDLLTGEATHGELEYDY